MSAANELDRAMERFAPDTAAAMRLCTLVDDAARRLVGEESARDAYDPVVPSGDNVRRHLDVDDEMVESVRTVGIVEPLVVEECVEPDELEFHGYHVIAGHRRLEAATRAGLTDVPCMVRAKVEDAERIELMLIENLQRADLRPLDEARGYQRLVDLGLTQRDIAERVHCNQSHVSRRIGLLDLPDKAQNEVDAGSITLEDASELLKLKEHPKELVAALKDAKNGRASWAVRDRLNKIESENAVAKAKADAKEKGWKVFTTSGYTGSKEFKRLTDSSFPSNSELHVDKKKHQSEPCHGVEINTQYGSKTVRPVCTDPKRHAAKGESKLKVPAKPKAEKRAPESAAERERKAELQAKKESSARRVEFLRPLLAKKPAQAKALPMVAAALVGLASWDTAKVACELLGLEVGTNVDGKKSIETLASTSADEMLRVAVAVSLARGELTARQAYCSFDEPEVTGLFGFLADAGYKPDDFETAQIEAKAQAAADLLALKSRWYARIEGTELPDVVKRGCHHIVETTDLHRAEDFLDEKAFEQSKDSITNWLYVCRRCGCTEDRACEGGCSWAENDLCSSCVDDAGKELPAL